MNQTANPNQNPRQRSISSASLFGLNPFDIDTSIYCVVGDSSTWSMDVYRLENGARAELLQQTPYPSMMDASIALDRFWSPEMLCPYFSTTSYDSAGNVIAPIHRDMVCTTDMQCAYQQMDKSLGLCKCSFRGTPGIYDAIPSPDRFAYCKDHSAKHKLMTLLFFVLLGFIFRRDRR